MITKHEEHIFTKCFFAMLVILIMSHKSVAEQEVVFEQLDKPRVIVLTDITNEPDDEQSMVRFLV